MPFAPLRAIYFDATPRCVIRQRTLLLARHHAATPRVTSIRAPAARYFRRLRHAPTLLNDSAADSMAVIVCFAADAFSFSYAAAFGFACFATSRFFAAFHAFSSRGFTFPLRLFLRLCFSLSPLCRRCRRCAALLPRHVLLLRDADSVRFYFSADIAPAPPCFLL